jgi:nucleotidyltransferase substrate binding protein (TIGR01987 family)
MNVKLIEFKKAVARLEEALLEPYSEFLRDSCIKRFEFSIELAWKTAKKIMGSSTSAPKDLIREMAQSGYIEDVSLWLKAIDMRNLSSHTYNDILATEVYEFAKMFLGQLKSLVTIFESK